MDYKYFRDGLLSLSLFLFLISLTLMIGSIILKPYIALEPIERDIIVGITITGQIFSLYYLIEALFLEKIIKLEMKYSIRFGKRILFMTILFFPHVILMGSLLFFNLHNLQVMMISLNLIIELILIGLLIKEAYDLLFRDESEKLFEFQKNRKLYLE